MGMSTQIMGFIAPTDPEYQRHSRVLRACLSGGVSLPKETADYFGESWPSESILEEKLSIEIPCEPWNDGSGSGFEVHTSNIPAGVSKIRFSNHF